VNFKEKNVLITGGSRGIGRAIALSFADHGANVAVVSSKSVPEDLIKKIEDKGCKCVHVAGNVADEESVRTIVNETVKKLGSIDILVNNAGIVIPGHLENTTVADFNKTMDINVLGTLLMSKYVVEHMKGNKKGVIVNIGSVAGMKGHVDRMAYCASKGAVIAMSRAMAAELVDDNIRVNVVCPGTTFTPALEQKIKNAENPAELEKTFVQRQPMGRLGKPEEIAHSVLYAACDEAAFMTGSVLVIDGGMTM